MRISIVDWTHQFLQQYIKPGDLVVDATMGNGGDTLFLANLVHAAIVTDSTPANKESASVIAFDVQELALTNTRDKLAKHGFTSETIVAPDDSEQKRDEVNKLNMSEKAEIVNQSTNNESITATLILDSHANMLNYVEEESAQAVVFNLGYLPGGDHSKATHAESTIPAIEAALNAIKRGGVISICIYSGGDSGFEEKNQVLEYLKTLDQRKYLVVKNEFYNKPNNPPIPVFIVKL